MFRTEFHFGLSLMMHLCKIILKYPAVIFQIFIENYDFIALSSHVKGMKDLASQKIYFQSFFTEKQKYTFFMKAVAIGPVPEK